MRIGEAAALRWRAYDPSLNLLGRLLIASSYNRKRKLEKAVKTERPREVPVHPTLAKMLAPWKLGGWKRLMGRQPTPDDLLIPSFERKHLLDPQVLERFHQDLQALGFRSRSSTSACALVSYSSCARPRIQAATQAEAAGAYYSPYYRRGASTQKLLHRAGLDSLAPVPRAGLEPNLRRKKLSSGRAVTPHRLVLTKVFIPPRPNQYRRFRAQTALEGSTAARKYPADHSERAPFHIELPSPFPFRPVPSWSSQHCCTPLQE